MTRFDRDTAVAALGDGDYEARIDPGWRIVHPNGGYVAAIAMRALQHAVDDPERQPRSLTLHYTAPPGEGPVRIRTRVERRGRSLTSLSLRLEQDDRLLALGLAAFSRPRESQELSQATAPPVAAPEDCEPLPVHPERSSPFRRRFVQRPAIGGFPFSGSVQAESGGWIRLTEPHPLDVPMVTALMDAWPPAVFTWMHEMPKMGGVPTVDLTLHFRAGLPPDDAKPEDYALVRFRTRTVQDGFLEEDGELWSRGGTLLAQSRQLAILI